MTNCLFFAARQAMSVVVFSSFLIVTAALPCSLTNCTFERLSLLENSARNLTFASSRVLCKNRAQPMSLVTPTDAQTAMSMFSMCNSSFLAFRLNGTIDGENACAWRDVDDPGFVVPANSSLWFKQGNFFEPNNGGSAKANTPCEMVRVPNAPYSEPCTQFHCDQGRGGYCEPKSLDRKCEDPARYFETRCVVCGRIEQEQPLTFPPAETSSSSILPTKASSPTNSSASSTSATVASAPASTNLPVTSAGVPASSSVPAIAGGVVGGVLLLGLLGLLALLWLRQRRRSAPPEPTPSTTHQSACCYRSQYGSALTALP